MPISLKDFEDTGALLTGHFRLSSGLHSDKYLQCARLLMWPRRAEQAGRELADELREFGARVVVSPALGGVVIGQETARGLDVRAMFVERKDGAFSLRRGFLARAGRDGRRRRGRLHDRQVDARGGRGGRVRRRTRRRGRFVVDRGVPKDAFSVPSRSLLSLSVPAWPETECPLCASGVTIEAPGSRFQKA